MEGGWREDGGKGGWMEDGGINFFSFVAANTQQPS
jgi:hypothetical protein